MPIITYEPNNTQRVLDFIGKQPPCPVCGDYGEYDGEYGPIACPVCNSRLIPFVNSDGKRVYADWEDSILKDSGGHLRLIKKENGE